MLQVVSSKSSSGNCVTIKYAYDAHEVTLSAPVERLEVLYELLVEFENMKDNGIDLSNAIKFQVEKASLTIFKAQFSSIWLKNSGFMLNVLLSKLLPFSLERRL